MYRFLYGRNVAVCCCSLVLRLSRLFADCALLECVKKSAEGIIMCDPVDDYCVV